nr:MFS transporter [uncultured Acidocella sp.]
MDRPVASPRVRAIQRTALGMLVLSGSINTIDRAALSVANPLIRHDLHLSIAEMGLLLSAFLWAYAFSQLPTGALIDRMGPRRLLAIGLAVWSGAQFLCGFVVNIGQFAAARVLLGIGEAPNFPTGGRVVRDWFNLRERGMATGIFNGASYVGTGLAPPLLTFLMLGWGWRWMFSIMGALGLGAALLWYLVYRDPAQVNLTAAENRYRTAGDATEAVHPIHFAAWKRLFRCRTTWGMIFGFFGVIYVNWLFNAWLPGYLEMARHMSIAKSGWVAALPYIFAIFGSLSGGFVVDKLMVRGFSRVASRLVPLCTAMALNALLVVAVALINDNTLAVACLCGSLFCGTVSTACAWAMVSVIAPANCTGSLGAMQNFGGYVGGALAPMVTGFIVQATGSFVPALLVGAGMCVFAAVAYSTIRRPITPEDLEPPGPHLTPVRA